QQSPPLLYTLSLHDALPIYEALIRFLERMRADGKIRFFGIGTEAGTLLSDLSGYPPQYEVFQFNNHILNRAIDRFTGRTRARILDRKSARLNSSHLVISYAV